MLSFELDAMSCGEILQFANVQFVQHVGLLVSSNCLSLLSLKDVPTIRALLFFKVFREGRLCAG